MTNGTVLQDLPLGPYSIFFAIPHIPYSSFREVQNQIISKIFFLEALTESISTNYYLNSRVKRRYQLL